MWVLVGTPICVPGSITNHTFVFSGPMGNAPNIGLWSSISATPVSTPSNYSSEDSDSAYSSSVLRMISIVYIHVIII